MAVVGGGIIGVSTAAAIRSLDPKVTVLLLEADRIGSGASGRNAGFVMPGTHTDYLTAADQYGEEVARRIWQFTLENITLVQELDAPAIEFEATGSVLAAGDEEEARRLEHAAPLMTAVTDRVAYLDAPTLSRRTGSTGFHGGLAMGDGGVVNPVLLVQRLAARSGATVLENWPVDSISQAGDGWRVEGPGGQVDADRVVLCANAYLPRLLSGAAHWVRPVRAQMLSTAPTDHFLNVPVYSHGGYFYMRQRRDGRILLGGARHLHRDVEVGYEDAVTEPLQADLEHYLALHFPQLAGLAVERRWSGTMGFSPDGLPVAGHVPHMPGVFAACGFTGHGMGYGLRFGQMMARLVLGLGDEAHNLFDVARLKRPT